MSKLILTSLAVLLLSGPLLYAGLESDYLGLNMRGYNLLSINSREGIASDIYYAFGYKGGYYTFTYTTFIEMLLSDMYMLGINRRMLAKKVLDDRILLNVGVGATLATNSSVYSMSADVKLGMSLVLARWARLSIDMDNFLYSDSSVSEIMIQFDTNRLSNRFSFGFGVPVRMYMPYSGGASTTANGTFKLDLRYSFK